MSPKVLDRSFVLKQTLSRRLTAPEAARHLNVTVRHLFRLKKEFRERGIHSLVHGNRGKRPKHAIPTEIVDEVIQMARGILHGANSTHFSELLEEMREIRLSGKTIGRILKKARISCPKTHAPPRKYRRRKRRLQEGELVQMDASPFAWLEDRGPIMSLHGAIDDATGKILGLHFRPTEDTVGYLQVLQQVLASGIPRAFYTDRAGIFVPANPGNLTMEEQLEGKTKAHTQFGKILEELEIAHIEALSPQAKGRIERLWGTLQDRLLIELRLAEISEIADANAFLKSFIPRFNQRFAVMPQEPCLAYRQIPPGLDLDLLLTLREDRKALSDSTVSIDRTLYSLMDSAGRKASFRRRAPIQIRTHLDGSISAWAEGKRFSLQAWEAPRKQQEKPSSHPQQKQRSTTPAKDHPWRRFSLNPTQAQALHQGSGPRRPGAAGPPAAK